MKKYEIGYTTGVFDLFHIGHLNILKRAKAQCEYLIVGVSTDELVLSYKSKKPVIPFEERFQIVEAIKYVDKVVPQESLDKVEGFSRLKEDVLNKEKFFGKNCGNSQKTNKCALFVGDDWKGTQSWNKYEQELGKIGVDVVYLPRTEGISSSMLKDTLNMKKEA